ncbi:MAG: class F sortase [Propionibacteriales bacterium]|nr:class F sortase [Propionibacteriales bacterium]
MSEQSAVMSSLSTRRRIALVALVLATLFAVVWTFWPQADPAGGPAVAAPQVIEPPTVLKPAGCARPVAKPFRPTRISIAGITRDAEVLQLGRDANNVPRAASITTAGKTQFGWDDPAKATPGVNDPAKPPGALPGDARGNVLLNAHTWPDGQAPALGNLLLADLDVGDKIVVKGKGKNTQLCYKVTKRIVIKAADGSADYYQSDGPPQLALIVCSAPRLGPGNWVHRTIWFASPVSS